MAEATIIDGRALAGELRQHVAAAALPRSVVLWSVVSGLHPVLMLVLLAIVPMRSRFFHSRPITPIRLKSYTA